MFSKRHYEAIAKAMNAASRYCETGEQRRGVQRAVGCLIETLKLDNPAFDRRRFEAASEAAPEADWQRQARKALVEG